MELRIGHGYDIHRLVMGRKLILGGIEIPFEYGLLGHSDADCLCHAITDALLGALALPNIGQFYPDTDKKTIGITSTEILQNIYKNEILQRNYKIINIDCTIIAQEPKLAPHLNLMCQNLTKLLQLSGGQVGIKATTHEGLDAIGEKKAIACHSVCLLENLGLCRKVKNKLFDLFSPCGLIQEQCSWINPQIQVQEAVPPDGDSKGT